TVDPPGFGPELSFGHTFAAASPDRLAIIKIARGGTSLHQHWVPHDTDNPDTLTNLTLHHARRALEQLREQGYSPRLRGIVWYQGEADTRPANPAPERYREQLRRLIDRFRVELAGGAAVPFVLFRVHPHNGETPFYEQVRSGIVEVAEADPAGAWIDVDDLHYPDALHPDGPSLLTAGDRAAQALLALKFEGGEQKEESGEEPAETAPRDHSLNHDIAPPPPPGEAETEAEAEAAPASSSPTRVKHGPVLGDAPPPGPPRLIALMNQKGGVGKTTTAVSVGSALARAGRRVLMIDLDPQAHLTLSLGYDPNDLDKSLYDLMTDDQTTASEVVCIADNQPNLGLLPAETNLAGVERELADQMATGTAQTVLRHKAGDLIAQFDYVLFDCPPALNLLTINALTLAEEVVVPMQAHYLAMQGLTKLLETISMVRRGINPGLKVSGVVLCMFEGNTLLAGEIVEELSGFFESSRGSGQPWADAVVFDPPIRRNIKLAEAPSYGVSIHEYAPESHGARDYLRLAASIEGKRADATPASAARGESTGRSPSA
ncbi:MAG: AAA family ATPase, partial [Phycisphaeraceae bacterium]